jgi:hypothetical protein
MNDLVEGMVEAVEKGEGDLDDSDVDNNSNTERERERDNKIWRNNSNCKWKLLI